MHARCRNPYLYIYISIYLYIYISIYASGQLALIIIYVHVMHILIYMQACMHIYRHVPQPSYKLLELLE